MIIGLVGKKESGKSTVAKYLVDNHNFIQLAFATPLKDMLIKAGLCTYEEVYIQKTPQSRFLMQRIGTDIIRKQIDSDFWVKKFFELYYDTILHNNVVIDDIRFENEFEFVEKVLNAYTVYIDRPAQLGNSIDTHISETGVDKLKDRCLIHIDNSGSISDLLTQIHLRVKLTLG
jgi:hypothetical protein